MKNKWVKKSLFIHTVTWQREEKKKHMRNEVMGIENILTTVMLFMCKS